MKDRKIIELSKKNKALALQAEGLKNKAAKAAEFAIQLKKERESALDSTGGAAANTDTQGGTNLEADKRVRELEKRITKMRNENQEQKLLIEKAVRLLEREIGEIVDINELSKEESQWKGRS